MTKRENPKPEEREIVGFGVTGGRSGFKCRQSTLRRHTALIRSKI